jgi:hypothetical protein
MKSRVLKRAAKPKGRIRYSFYQTAERASREARRRWFLPVLAAPPFSTFHF